jgi:hypothetical protein
MVQESIIADLRKHSCELESVAEPDLMANDPTRIPVRQMMGAVAQYRTVSDSAETLWRTHEQRAMEGRSEGASRMGITRARRQHWNA